MIQSRRQASSQAPEDTPSSPPLSRQFSNQALPRTEFKLPESNTTTWFADHIANASMSSLSDLTVYRSKRLVLDTLGVGYLGSSTDITHSIVRWALESGLMPNDHSLAKSSSGSVVWGTEGMKTSPAFAAFINGISIHSMDFDDTWHPATHPSGPVLPAILALAETMTGPFAPTGEDILLAYNVGVQVQGLLLRCSRQAEEIPRRFHPPAVVGVMGSAAAVSKLLGFGPKKSRHALAIAASFAGAPMANAGTKTKPLHCGKSARFGLEAALMADYGVEGNEDILDMKSGFGAFYDDYDPREFLELNADRPEFVLHDQDVAIKRFPAHLGMHWAVDATMEVRNAISGAHFHFDPQIVKSVKITAPKSRYIDRPLPSSEHEARHSFQFMVCTTLLDGEVIPESFHHSYLHRPLLNNLLQKATVITPEDNIPSFDEMYVEVHVQLQDGTTVTGRCETPYGHWRRPLSDVHVQEKFLANTKAMPFEIQSEIIKTVQTVDSSSDISDLHELLKF